MYLSPYRPMRFLRIQLGCDTVPAEILRDTLTSYQICAWVPAHESTHDGTKIKGERKTWYVFKTDRRILCVDDKYNPPWEGNVIDIFMAQEGLVLKRLG